MNCPNCGALYEPGARFCGICGTALTGGKKGSHRVPILILIALSILGTVVFFATGGGTPAERPGFYQDDAFTVEDGVVYAMDLTGVREITVPETIGGMTITDVGEYAFWDSDSLVTVDLPDTVQTIGSSAFEDCGSLRAMDLPPSLTVIGDYAFANCDSLEAIRIPASVTEIGMDAFFRCDSLSFVFYDGTWAQWQALCDQELGPRTLICCADGNHPQAE